MTTSGNPTLNGQITWAVECWLLILSMSIAECKMLIVDLPRIDMSIYPGSIQKLGTHFWSRFPNFNLCYSASPSWEIEIVRLFVYA